MEMTFEQWVEKYKPIKNGCGGFEAYGNLNSYNPFCIWTSVDDAQGGIQLICGTHRINTLNYFVTEVPFEEGEYIYVFLLKGDYDE